jgi:hypothetical protein
MIREKVNIGPHMGLVRFNIFIHRVLDDGSIDPEVVDCNDEFQKLGMTNLGEIHVTGYDKNNCIEKVKDILENLGKSNGKKRK